ncbi:MAG TPA: inorganic phosphate transporter [Pelobium sp.]|nr:inorganic phosphate transporter [Pelobium sp.]
MAPLIWLFILIACSIAFDVFNGFNDSANITATIISSHSMSVKTALAIATIAGFAGPFIFGFAVAKTIASDIVVAQYISTPVLAAALISATAWSFITWTYGIPSSSSHALIGGLIGAVMIGSGIKVLLVGGIIKVSIALLFSPVAGLFFGWITIKTIYRLLKNATPGVNYFFKLGQIPTAIILAASNGANDSQKTMGIITLGLMSAGYQDHFFVPLWVVLVCAGAKSIGSLVGGWRLMRRMGAGFYKIKPLHSFASQLASSTVIALSSILGGPVSTTQVVSMSIVGAGAGERLSKVRWLTLKDIFLSWILTIPFTVVFAIPVYLLLKFFFL